MSQTNEHAFETYVEEILLTRSGWSSGSNAEWDMERALFPAQVFAFIEATQPKLWSEIPAQNGIEMGALAGKVDEAVKWLQEYRTALITIAVTGKNDTHDTEESKL